jgi:thioredoxin reductase (NADPH)
MVLATGAFYRRLGIPQLEAMIGAGVFYGATVTEAEAMSGEDVFVVGGGNSAGQASVHLATFANHVTLLVRGSSLAASMSDYLVKELDSKGNIEIRYQTEVVDGWGETRLEQLTLRDRESGQMDTVPAAVFVLIGAEPRTEWLPHEIARDRWGYVLTGNDLARTQDARGPRPAAAELARDQPDRSVRGGRRPPRFRQAGCLGRRGLDRDFGWCMSTWPSISDDDRRSCLA